VYSTLQATQADYGWYAREEEQLWRQES